MLTNQLNQDFLDIMAEKFPCTAFSIRQGIGLKNHAVSVNDWLNNLEDKKTRTVKKALENQLGKLWKDFGWQNQTNIYKTFIALMCAVANGKNIDLVLSDINAWSVAALSSKDISDILVFIPYEYVKEAEEWTNENSKYHAWNLTLALAAIDNAKKYGGVLLNAQFLWLSYFDRELWLMLSSYGRREPFVEVCGVDSHYRLEKIQEIAIEKAFMREIALSIL